MTIYQTPIDEETEMHMIEMCSGEIAKLDFVYDSADAFPEPYMQISKLQALTMQPLIKSLSIRRILEVGTFVGYSSLVMADAIPEGGSITSIEIEKDFHSQALLNKYKFESSLNKHIVIDFVNADAKDVVPQIDGDSIDMFFLDGDKPHYDFYYRWAADNMRSGSYLVVDNVLFKGAVVHDKENRYAKSIASMVSIMKTEQLFDYFYLPVGDCMIVAKKK